MHEVAELRYELHDLLVEKSSKLSMESRFAQFAQKLTDYDAALVEWEAKLPASFRSKEVQIASLRPQDPRTSLVSSQDFFDSILFYPSLLAAVAYSHVRCVRILVLQSLRDCRMTLGQPDDCGKLESAEKAVMTDLCRSMFQFLNCGTGESVMWPEVEILSGMRGVFLFWPLQIVASASHLTLPLATQGQLRFVKAVLTYIHQKRGLPQGQSNLLAVR